MKFDLKLQGNIHNLMRQCGYCFEREENGELAFSRILGASKSGYPRFHIYVRVGKFPRETSINLHLDQKKPVYKGTPAHSAEHRGELVKREAERIKQILF